MLLLNADEYAYNYTHGRDLKFRGVGVGQKPWNFRRGERGVASMKIFFPTGLNFHTVVRKVSLFTFASQVAKAKKKKMINLANLKHKMNIFVLLGSIFCRR